MKGRVDSKRTVCIMRRFCLILCFVLFAVVSYAQKVPTIVMDGGVEEKSTDLDARSYYPKYDINDRLCSLVKVTIINWPKNPLTLEVGGLGVVDRVEKRELGEIWFYVPAQVKNLRFKCADYITPEPIPVSFKEGTVYTIRLVADTVVETITKVALSSNYLKLGISVPNCKISLGKTTGYELLSTYSKSGNFAERLEYGIYYYKVEHPDYETFYGVVELGAATPKQLVTLIPAFGYLDIYTSPAGATAYINGKVVGTLEQKRLPLWAMARARVLMRCCAHAMRPLLSPVPIPRRRFGWITNLWVKVVGEVVWVV